MAEDKRVDKQLFVFSARPKIRMPRALRSRCVKQVGEQVNLLIPFLVSQHIHSLSVQLMNNVHLANITLYLASSHLFSLFSPQLIRESPNLWCPGLRTVNLWIQRGSTSGTVTRTASCLSAQLRGRTLAFTR